MFGPTGIGVLYGRKSLLERMPPYQGGGDMIDYVGFERTTFAEPPRRFEAGTPNIAGAAGLARAINYLEHLGFENLEPYERGLAFYAESRLNEIRGLKFLGESRTKAGVISFTLKNVHPHDAATILDSFGVAVRAGQHCAQPLMRRFGIPAAIRASLAFYNTGEEIDRLVNGLKYAVKLFA